METRNALWVFYQGQVYFVARRFKKRAPDCMRLDDLVSDGNMGLWHALEYFQPELGYAFSTFAVGRIRGAMYDSLRQEQREQRGKVSLESVAGVEWIADPRARDPALLAEEREAAPLALIP